MCSENDRRFWILLRAAFSNSLAFTLIYKYAKDAVVQISTELRPVTMLLFEGSSKTGVFRHLSNNVFRSLYLPKYMSYEDHLWFENVQNIIYMSKIQKKIERKVFPLRDNCIWVGCLKLSLLRREYLWPALNPLKNSPEILSIIKRDLFELNFLPSDQ